MALNETLIAKLRGLFSTAAVAQSFERLPQLPSVVMDMVYPQARRAQHPFALIAKSELVKIAGAVPVVRRGTPAVNIAAGSMDIDFIEPQPIEVKDFISAKELNDLAVLLSTDNKPAIQAFIDGKIDNFRRAVMLTTEALAAQSITGQIAYPMQTEGGHDTYSLDYGATLSFAPAKLWDAADCTIGQILADLIAMTQALALAGYGAKIEWLLGTKAFLNLANKVLALPGDSKVKAEVTEEGIQIAGFFLKLSRGIYKDPVNLATVNQAVAPHKLVAIAQDAPHSFRYCAIDDIEAGLQALPFFVTKPEITRDPSGLKLVAKSKPIHMPVVKGLCWAEVTNQ